MSCQFGSEKKPEAPSLFVVDDNPFCYIFGADGLLCKIGKIIVAVAEGKKPVKAIIRGQLLQILQDAISGDYVLTSVFCSLEPPPEPAPINAADIAAYLISLADPTGLAPSGELPQKVKDFWRIKKWAEYCRCGTVAPALPLPPPFNPVDIPPCGSCYSRQYPLITMFYWQGNFAMVNGQPLTVEQRIQQWQAGNFFMTVTRNGFTTTLFLPDFEFTGYFFARRNVFLPEFPSSTFNYFSMQAMSGHTARYAREGRQVQFFLPPYNLTVRIQNGYPDPVFLDVNKQPMAIPDIEQSIMLPPCVKTSFTGACAPDDYDIFPVEPSSFNLNDFCFNNPANPVCSKPKKDCCCPEYQWSANHGLWLR